MKVFSLALTAVLLTTPNAWSTKRLVRQNTPTQLKGFDSCTALGEHLQKEFLNQPTYSHYLDDIGGCDGCEMDFVAEMAPATERMQPKEKSVLSKAGSGAPASMALADAPNIRTGTNNQVAGVDEADFVKFDGKYIYQLHTNQLKIVKAWPAISMSMLSSINIVGLPRELLIDENRAIAISQNSNRSVVSVIDIQNRNNPILEVQFEIPGNYITARKIGSSLRIINSDYDVKLNNQNSQENNGWFVSMSNKKVSAKELLSLQSSVKVLGNNRTDIDVLEDCKHIYAPEKAIQGHVTRIVSLDLKNRRYAETLAFINPETVYASENSIYIAQQGWDNAQFTAIHKFNLKSEQNVDYAASGKINGHLINQFAMDEHNGYLRVATNGNEKTHLFRWETVNRVQVLKQNKKSLDVYGSSQNLAHGERLYSVRFDGDQGYLVTFKQVDPLFTMDLSNPRKPKMVGELKVPGFSTYIHMIDKNHLLAIGQDADVNTGRPKGLKLSVFDVSNFSKPKEVKSLIFNSTVSSEASYEHKAFNFYPEKGILAIPVAGQVMNYNTAPVTRSSLLLFKVTNKDITSNGELGMSDMVTSYNSTVRRAFFADEIVLVIASSGIRAANITQPQNPLATLLFENRLATGW